MRPRFGVYVLWFIAQDLGFRRGEDRAENVNKAVDDLFKGLGFKLLFSAQCSGFRV